MCVLSATSSGEDFDIRDFHEEILRLGPVPIHVLELAVYQWIQAEVGIASHSVAPSNAALVLTTAMFVRVFLRLPYIAA